MLLPFLAACFNQHRLQLLWQAPIASETTPLVQNGTVFVSGFRAGHPEESKRLFALNLQTGEALWVSADTIQEVYGASGAYVFCRNEANHLIQLEAANGHKLFESSDTDIPVFDENRTGDRKIQTPGGVFQIQTGQKPAPKASWMQGAAVYQGIAWQRQIGSISAGEAFFLRTTYDGDYQGSRNWTNTPPNSALEGFDVATGKSLFKTKPLKFTAFSTPIEANGVLLHTSIAVMKEGKSGVWAYKLP